MKRHRARALIGDDTGTQVAPTRMPETAPRTADVVLEIGSPRSECKDALEPIANIPWLDDLPARVANAPAQMEHVGSKVVAGHGQRGREIGNELRPVRIADALKSGQAAVEHAENIQVWAVITECWVERVECAASRDDFQGASPVVASGGLDRHPEPVGGKCQTLWSIA